MGLSIFNIILFVISASIWISYAYQANYWSNYVRPPLQGHRPPRQTFIDVLSFAQVFNTLFTLQYIYEIALTIIIIVITIKIIIWMRLWVFVKLILKAFATVFVPVLGVITFLLLLYMGMASVFAINYGKYLPEFSTPWDAFISAFKFLHGGIDFDRYVQFVPSPILFVFYLFHLFIVGYTVVNIFIAILFEMYATIGDFGTIGTSSFSFGPHVEELKASFRYDLQAILSEIPESQEKITLTDLKTIITNYNDLLLDLGSPLDGPQPLPDVDCTSMASDEEVVSLNTERNTDIVDDKASFY